MSSFNRIKLIASLVFLACAAPAMAGKGDSKIIVVNKSSWAIHQMYLSPTDDEDWGDDQLGHQVINTGETFTLSGVPCDKWDIRVVDEDGDECVIPNVGLCGDTDRWVINDKDLLGCQSATE
jgi:hypothetical protein